MFKLEDASAVLSETFLETRVLNEHLKGDVYFKQRRREKNVKCQATELRAQFSMEKGSPASLRNYKYD